MSDARLTITDLHKLKDLIRVNLEACEAGRGEALTLLFGTSRSGKTTTFCFLSGRRMVERKIQVPVFQNHVMEQSVFDLYLLPDEKSPIGHGYLSKTETMSFSPFNGWILVDTAGLFEPKGPIEEIAHMVALEQILKISKSVTPILLLNVEELSGTASFMSMVLKITNTLISSEQMMDDSLLVILTHINSEKDKIITKLGQLQQSMAEKPLVLDKILGWLLSNSNHVLLLENPVTDDPNRFWTSIKALQPIQGLRKFCLEDNSKIKFLALMEELKTQLLEWIEQRAFDDIIGVLETLMFLNEHIPTLVSDTIGYFLQHVANVLQKEYQGIQRQVTLILTNKRVDEQHIIEIRSFCDLIQRSHQFRSLPDVVTQLEALDSFDHWLVQSVKKFAEQMPFLVENKEWQSCQLQLNVLHTLSTQISDIGLQKFYIQCKDDIITHLKMKLDGIDVSALQFFLEKLNIQELINVCSSLEQVETYISNHMIGEFSSAAMLRDLKACFARCLQNALDDFTALIDSLNSDPSQDTRLIADVLAASRNISQFEGLHPFFGDELCKSAYSKVRGKLDAQLGDLLDQLESDNSIHETSLLACHVLTKYEPRADLWRRFVKVTDGTKAQVKTYLKKVKVPLRKWKTLQDDLVIDKVVRSCKKIKGWVWIDPLTNNFGSTAYEKVKQHLITCITRVNQTLETCWVMKNFDEVNMPYIVLKKMSEAGLFEIAGRQSNAILDKHGTLVIDECTKISNECGREEFIVDPAKTEEFLKTLEGFRRLHSFGIKDVQNVVKNIEDSYQTYCKLRMKQLLMSSEDLPDTTFVQQQLLVLDWMQQCATKQYLGAITQGYYQDAVHLVQSQLKLLSNTFNEFIDAGDLTRANEINERLKLYANFQLHLPDIQSERDKRIKALSHGNQNIEQQIKQEIDSNQWRCAVIQNLLELLTGNHSIYEKNVKYAIFVFRDSMEKLETTIANLGDHYTTNCDQFISQLAIFRRVSVLGTIFNKFDCDLEKERQEVVSKIVSWFSQQLDDAQRQMERFMFNLATERQLTLTHLYKRVNNIIELGDECKSKFEEFECAKNSTLDEIVNKVTTYLNERKYAEVTILWQNTKCKSRNSTTDTDIHENDAFSRVKSAILEYFKARCAQITQISDSHSLSDANSQLKALKNDLSSEEKLLRVVSHVLKITKKELVEFSDKRKQTFKILLETKDPNQVVNIKEKLQGEKDPKQSDFYKHKVQCRVESLIQNIIQQMTMQHYNFSFLNDFKLVLEYRNQLRNLLDITKFSELESLIRGYQIQREKTLIHCLETVNFQHLPSCFEDYCMLSELVLLIDQNQDMIIAIRRAITNLCASGIKFQSAFHSARKARDINTLYHEAVHIEEFSPTVLSLRDQWHLRLQTMILQEDYDPLRSIIPNLFEKYLYPQQLDETLKVFINELLKLCVEWLENGRFKELEKLLDGIYKLPKVVRKPWNSSVECVTIIKTYFDAKAQEGFEAWRAFPKKLDVLSNILQAFVNGEIVIQKLATFFNVIVANPLNEIKADIKREMDQLQHTAELSRAARSMLELRGLYEKIPALEPFISTSLRKYTEVLSENGEIFSLYTELNRCQTGDDPLLVKYMVDEFPAFKGFLQVFLAEKTRQFGIDYALRKLKKRGPNGTQVSLTNYESVKLKTLYKQFEDVYNQLIHTYVTMPSFPEKIPASLNELLKNKKISTILPEVIAHIFALWTLTKSDVRLVASSKNNDYFMKPHPVQVLSIFVLLAADTLDKPQQIKNHLIELKTGQGKSIVLGVCAIVFVLIGYDVDVVCYSNILSDRDRSDFQDLFEKFGVVDKIEYGTLEKLSENRVNRNGSVRDLVHSFSSNQPLPKGVEPLLGPCHRVLLIDEVDVFFSPTFLGETYNPLSILVDDRCYNVLLYIWENHMSPTFSIQSVMKHDSFVRLVKQYPLMERLLKFQLEQMIEDVKNFDDLKYEINEVTHKIGYKLHDNFNYTISHGHKTTFAYFHAKDTGKITEPELKANVGFHLYCGRFSYAEIPKSYVFVLGVTGTLKSLAPAELNIIQNEYKINEFSYMPSMYGKGLDFKKFSDVEVMPNLDQYFKRIQNLGVQYTKKGHAVLIFFPEAIRIESFQNSEYNVPGWNVLDEATKDKPAAIRKATCAGQCSLIPSVLGRGTDFVCHDQQVIDAGGVVVIQAFWSSVPSEEIQIKGRTARQGAAGIYRVVLLQSDLLSLFPSEQELKVAVHSQDLRSTLKRIQKTNYADVVNGLQEKVAAARDVHVISDKLRLSLLTRNNPQQTWQYLLDINRTFFGSQNVESFYIILCLDESSSMQGARWTQLKEAVDGFVADRLSKCQQADRVCTDLLTIMCYNDKARRVVEDAPLELNVSQKLVQQGGLTDFAVAIAESIKKLDEIKLDGKTPVFLIMSDGECSSGDAEMISLYQKYQPHGLRVFVVGFGTDADTSKLERLAALGHGTYSFGATGDLLKQEFERIASILSCPVLHSQ